MRPNDVDALHEPLCPEAEVSLHLPSPHDLPSDLLPLTLLMLFVTPLWFLFIYFFRSASDMVFSRSRFSFHLY